MARHRIAVVALALLCASGCSSGGEPPRPSGPAATGGARQAVGAYVDALNARSTAGLIRAGGVPEAPWSRREAARIIAGKGGRDWWIRDLRIEYDLGPDVGSAHLVARDAGGESLRETFTVLRAGGAWHVSVFDDQPVPGGKSAASTRAPDS
ncbi:hypothetical protein ACIRU3_24245 [Streptomyces sp. NPDC101151]|uniref:hypothetical protein n=1 Tax=Streptomyces sp. NPDC101151 TaxID=3366115 RepID=UPI003805B2C6